MRYILSIVLLICTFCTKAQTLIWHDEFNADGPVNEDYWNFETGFVRNHEFQWYQPNNAYQTNGTLILEGRIDSIPNPHYNPNARKSNWKSSRPFARYSSASINTRGKI